MFRRKLLLSIIAALFSSAAAVRKNPHGLGLGSQRESCTTTKTKNGLQCFSGDFGVGRSPRHFQETISAKKGYTFIPHPQRQGLPFRGGNRLTHLGVFWKHDHFRSTIYIYFFCEGLQHRNIDRALHERARLRGYYAVFRGEMLSSRRVRRSEISPSSSSSSSSSSPPSVRALTPQKRRSLLVELRAEVDFFIFLNICSEGGYHAAGGVARFRALTLLAILQGSTTEALRTYAQSTPSEPTRTSPYNFLF